MDDRARKKREVKVGEEIRTVDVPVSAPEANESSASSAHSKVPKVEERAVSLRKLVDARKAEVLLFEERYRKTSGGCHGGEGHRKRAFQLLPRHMRRRAMSYNPYLVPLRLRERAKRESQKTEAPEGHKHLIGGGWRLSRRRSEFRRLDIIRPGNKSSVEGAKKMEYKKRDFAVLETHMWHAKRFHMINYAGYKIPKEATLRGRSAVLRTAKQKVVAFESSFVKPVVVTASSLATMSKILAELSLDARDLLHPAHLRRLQSCFLKRKIFIDDSGAPSTAKAKSHQKMTSFFEPLSPCQVHGLIIPEGSSNQAIRLFFWLDPHSLPIVLKEIESISKRIETPKGEADVTITAQWEALDNRFELFGPTASQALSKLLLAVDPDERASLDKVLASRPKLIPAGTTLALKVKDPRIVRFARRFEEAAAKDQPSEAPSNNLLSMMANLMLHQNGKGGKSDFERGALSNTSIDSSPLLKHGTYDWCKYRDHETEKADTLTTVERESEVSILLQRFPKGEDGHEGWILTVPRSWGATFWKQLIRCGVRPIGRRERSEIKFENLCPRFPEDFPSTPGYQSYIEQKYSDLFGAWMRRPSQKRLNHSKLGFSSPFRPDWHHLFMSSNRVYQSMDSDSHRVHLTYKFGATNWNSKNRSESALTHSLPENMLSLEWKSNVDANSTEKSKDQAASKTVWTLSDGKSSGMSIDGEKTIHKHVLLDLVPVAIVLERGGTVPTFNAHLFDLSCYESVKRSQKHAIGFESEAVGYVTSGGYCMSRGKSAGLAFVTLAYWRSIASSQTPEVLIRNITSREYHIATIMPLDAIFG